MAKYKESPPAQVEYTRNYIDKIFAHVDTQEVFRITLPSLIKHLKTKGLRLSEIGYLLGTSPSLVALWETAGDTMPGIKVEASALRRITIDGKAVCLRGDPERTINQYRIFHSQFAHSDSKLHDIGLDGSEWTYYET